MAEINDLDIVDANNTARFPEGQAPSTVNNGARALEGLVARWHKDINASVLTTGTLTAYVYAANQTITAYYDGLTLGVDFHVACGAAPTINVDALGAKALLWPDGIALVADDIPIDAKMLIIYDATSFQVISASGATITRANIQGQTFTAFDDTGAADAYVITPVPAITAYVKYQAWVVDIANANTAASTINISGLGTRNIFDFRTGAALVGGEMLAGINWFIDDGTQIILLTSTPSVNVQTFTSSGTWTKPSGITVVKVEIWGGGGGGGQVSTGSSSGGGGGAYVRHSFDAADLGGTETVTIGAGGDGGGAPTDGGDTTFDVLIAGGGGEGKIGSTSDDRGGTGGAWGIGAVAQSLTQKYGVPFDGRQGSASPGNPPAGASWGGAGGGCGGFGDGSAGGEALYSGGGGGGHSDAGGVSLFGGNGGAGGGAQGVAGTQPGGGGGGAANGGGLGGAGGAGQCIVTSW